MKYILLLLITAGISLNLYGQKSITGKITDEGEQPLEYATVMLKAAADSSIVAFATTNDKGIYRLEVANEGEFIFQVSYVGYTSQYHALQLRANINKTTTLNFALKEDAVGLQELIVKGRKTGVQFGADTIRYDVKHFKDGSEVVLGDVLNKLPGVVVDDKRSIKAHGKTVDKVLLNGQDFFQGNTQMATKNLSADIAEDVEILNNYSEYSMLSGFQSHEQTVINVGVNKSKLGKISGNLSGGGGLKDKFEFKGNILQIKSKSMTSVVGSLNNNGEEVFSIEDYIKLQGGMYDFLNSRGGSGNAIQLSQEEQQLLTPQNNVFKRTNGIGGLNIAYQPSSSLKINSYILYNHKTEQANEQTDYTYFSPESDPLAFSKSLSAKRRHNLFSGHLKVDYQPTSTFNLAYRGVISNMKSRNTEHAQDYILARSVLAAAETDAQIFKTRHNLSLLKSVNKHLLTAGFTFAQDNNPLDYGLTTDSLLLPVLSHAGNDSFSGLQRTKQKQWMSEVDLAFLYKINSSYFLSMGATISSTTRKYFSNIYNEDHSLNPCLNDYRLTMSNYQATLRLVKNLGVFQFKVGAAVHRYSFNTRRLAYEVVDKPVTKFTPEAEVSLYFSPKHVLSLSARHTNDMNDASAFVSKPVIQSYQSYIQNSRVSTLYQNNYQATLNYRLFDLYSNTMFIITGNYSRTHHSVAMNYLQDQLVTEKNPITVRPTESLIMRLYFNKGLGFIPWTVKFNLGYDAFTTHNQNFDIENKVRVNNTTSQVQLQSNYHKWIDAELQAGIDIQKSLLFDKSHKQTIQRYAGILKFNIKSRFRANVGAEYAINRSSGLDQRVCYLNADIYYTLSKQLELNLVGRNMLHLNQQDWTSVAYSDNYIVQKYFYQIPGHLMLKMKYSF